MHKESTVKIQCILKFWSVLVLYSLRRRVSPVSWERDSQFVGQTVVPFSSLPLFRSQSIKNQANNQNNLKKASIWNQEKSSEIRWNQMKSSEIKWNQMKSSEIKWNQVKSSEIKWNQVKSGEIRWNQVKSDEIRWNHWNQVKSLKSSEIKCNQVKSEISYTISRVIYPSLSVSSLNETFEYSWALMIIIFFTMVSLPMTIISATYEDFM